MSYQLNPHHLYNCMKNVFHQYKNKRGNKGGNKSMGERDCENRAVTNYMDAVLG